MGFNFKIVPMGPFNEAAREAHEATRRLTVSIRTSPMVPC
ncbi:Hypothetical protein CAP_0908 [Chondromyces apiculatus DSM 436]|uniref:Uncharacterized protein n=1 Tax=Chondromyces apiculatus DSM 436 TaxID=1192034 RepID=A0A017SUT9_9BACT|nr:Hypothetical protein CAP_0908 [Chondromyces apiculatus DSM 436]